MIIQIRKTDPELIESHILPTGQDTYVNGVLANILSGIATAGTVMGRNTLMDLHKLHEKINLEDNRLGIPNKIPMRHAKEPTLRGNVV